MRARTRNRTRNLLLALYVLVCVLALTWPAYDWVSERIHVRVLGLPFPFAWHIAWVVATFLVVLVYHLTSPTDDEQGDGR